MILIKTKRFLIINLLTILLINPFSIPQQNKILQSETKILSNVINLSGFITSSYFNEQVCNFNFNPDIKILINAPPVKEFIINKPTKLILFALPNGNSIEQTIGKKVKDGDDWHFDIQHLGAQTRFLRNQLTNYNVVIAYLETSQKSWPSWKSKHSDYATIIDSIVNYLTVLFMDYNPSIVLTGHSGGGSFTFGYLDGVREIPMNIERISFLDSNYGYDDKYGPLIVNWLNESDEHYLSVIAYNDSIALYNDNPIVSAKGGTWFRSKMLKDYLDNFFTFTTDENDEFITYTALNSRIKIILKKNPERLILHTVQVELNGFIQSILSGTKQECVGYKYFGERAYSHLVQDGKILTNILMIPPRPTSSITGSQFMNKIMSLSFEEREQEIYNEISAGNVPEFLRTLTKITNTFKDSAGKDHFCTYEVMPDYLAVGSDEDFCRIPMGPQTAQKIADLFGAVMPTRKLVNDIYAHCIVKLDPVTYKPVGDENTLVAKFLDHNQEIQNQYIDAEGMLGQLTGGIKKDVVISNKIADTLRTANVVIYGWHKLDGTPIQPLTNIHKNTYVDYSHGVRLLNAEMLIDGETIKIKSVLQDPILYKILSDENKPMSIISY
ncbi:MAG: hypothetical protein IPJ23_05095 [Ignavibacteriales bacterium]|nr:hypothetical protein [Ignavibacteriales bacterium]